MNLPVPEFKNDDNIKESSCPHSSLSLSPYSDDIVSNINDTNNYKSFGGPKRFQFTNGSVFEIVQYRCRNFTWDHFSLLLATLTGEQKISPQLLKKEFDTILTTRSNLLKNKSKLNEFLNSAFSIN